MLKGILPLKPDVVWGRNPTLDITKMMNDLKIRKPEIYAELIKIHYIKQI